MSMYEIFMYVMDLKILCHFWHGLLHAHEHATNECTCKLCRGRGGWKKEVIETHAQAFINPNLLSQHRRLDLNMTHIKVMVT